MRRTPWTGLAEKYDRQWRTPETPEYRAEMVRLITELLEANPRWTLLDAGCGTGFMFELLPDWAKARYRGIDYTADMVEFCRKRFPGGDFRLADILVDELPRANVVATQNVVQHITLWQIAVLRLVKVAGDAVIMCERTHGEPSRIVGYDPTRWRFNPRDMLECMRHCGDELWGPSQEPEVVGYPRHTDGRPGLVAIYRMVRQ